MIAFLNTGLSECNAPCGKGVTCHISIAVHKGQQTVLNIRISVCVRHAARSLQADHLLCYYACAIAKSGAGPGTAVSRNMEWSNSSHGEGCHLDCYMETVEVEK